MTKVNATLPTGGDENKPTKAQGCLSLIVVIIAIITIVWSIQAMM